MDIAELQHLAGIRNKFTGFTPYVPENISITGTEKSKIQRKKKIKPGTKEWFKLWFRYVRKRGRYISCWSRIRILYDWAYSTGL